MQNGVLESDVIQRGINVLPVYFWKKSSWDYKQWVKEFYRNSVTDQTRRFRIVASQPTAVQKNLRKTFIFCSYFLVYQSLSDNSHN